MMILFKCCNQILNKRSLILLRLLTLCERIDISRALDTELVESVRGSGCLSRGICHRTSNIVFAAVCGFDR